jgi:hypothetical protein
MQPSKISYGINRNLRFFSPKCYYDFFNLHKSKEFKYSKSSFNPLLLLGEVFSKLSEKAPNEKIATHFKISHQLKTWKK